MFRVKICGITSVDDAQLAAGAGADAVGLNFYASSPRAVTLETARRIVSVLPAGVCKVGLFVNAPAAEVMHVFDDLALDLIQLHGDEPPEYLVELQGRPVVRAFRLGADGVGPIAEYLVRTSAAGRTPRMILVDAYHPDRFGGTGQVADWELLATHRERLGGLPLILAGGLTPDNVAAAIEAVRPDAVDTSSGVESSPGKKDPLLLRRFVAAAQNAL